MTGIVLPLLLPILPLVVTAVDTSYSSHTRNTKTSIPASTVDLKDDLPALFGTVVGLAIFLITQGNMILSPIPKTDLQSVVSTDWDLFYYRKNACNNIKKEYKAEK